MDDFKRKKTQIKEIDSDLVAEYDKEVAKNANTFFRMTELTQKRTQNNAVENQDFLNTKLGKLVQTYAFGIVAIVNTAIWYPWSVRLVKRLGLKGFFNIHFAIVPILGHANAFVVGGLQGMGNVYKFRSNYAGSMATEYKL